MSADAQWEIVLDTTYRTFQERSEAVAALRERQQRQDEEIERLREVLRRTDEEVSRAHDIVWAAYPEWEGDEGRREPLNASLWRLHGILRPALAPPDAEVGDGLKEEE